MRAALCSAVIVVTLCAGSGAALGVAQSPGPATPAVRQLERWLEIFNAGDRDARQRFYKEQWAYTPNQGYHQDLFEQSGGFRILRVEPSTATRTVAIATQRD